MREEEDQEELDEVHEALEPRLNPADGSSLVLLQLLLEYLVDSEVRQPEAAPAGDDPCSQNTLSVFPGPGHNVIRSAQPTDKQECYGDVAVVVSSKGGVGGGGGGGGEVVSCSPGGLEVLARYELVVV